MFFHAVDDCNSEDAPPRLQGSEVFYRLILYRVGPSLLPLASFIAIPL